MLLTAPTVQSGTSERRPVHALHVLSTLNRGGAETWLMDVVRHCDCNRLQVDVCVVGREPGVFAEEFQCLGGKIVRCPLSRNPIEFSTKLRRYLSQEQYDVVHSHLYYFSGVVLRAAAQAGVPKRIAHIHPVEDLKSGQFLRAAYSRWMRRWIERYGTHFVGPTRASIEGFWGPGWESDPTKTVIYNGISVERFLKTIDRTAVRKQLSLPYDAKLVLNVARFAPHKRQGFLVDVAEYVVAERDDLYFLLIGAGPLRQAVMNKVAEKGLDQRFRFLSGLPDIDPYWLSADVFAFPSSNEGFGIVIAEAAAAGLPVVAQDIPGVREAATACRALTLLPLETKPEEWAKAVLTSLHSNPVDATVRRADLECFPFAISASIDALLGLYEQ